jgi:hypothetical protein
VLLVYWGFYGWWAVVCIIDDEHWNQDTLSATTFPERSYLTETLARSLRPQGSLKPLISKADRGNQTHGNFHSTFNLQGCQSVPENAMRTKTTFWEVAIGCRAVRATGRDHNGPKHHMVSRPHPENTD